MPLLPIIIRRCANYFDSPFGYNGSNSTANWTHSANSIIPFYTYFIIFILRSQIHNGINVTNILYYIKIGNEGPRFGWFTISSSDVPTWKIAEHMCATRKLRGHNTITWLVLFQNVSRSEVIDPIPLDSYTVRTLFIQKTHTFTRCVQVHNDFFF